MFAGDKEVARFTAVFQREAPLALPDDLPGHPLTAAPRSPEASAPRPGFQPAEPLSPPQPTLRPQGYHDLVEVRIAEGPYFNGPCTAWFRLRHPLVEGEIPSVYQQVAVAADSGNGVSAVLDLSTYLFVNSDLTINLLRRPRGEWVCLQAETYLGPDGSGLAESILYDVDGRIGRATQSLALRKRDAVEPTSAA
jgi:hypothetical protein